MVSSRNCLGLISVAYATILAMHGTVLAAAIPHDGVIRIVNDNPISHKVTGSHGAVAVENEQCSNTGVNVLKEGGNAVDAAIASGLCIGVINSFATGIGGGGFMLIRTPSGEYDFIDFREAAPAAATEDMYVHNISLSQNTGLAIAVPGEIRGYGLAHAKHGKLPWARLFRDAINIARNGFITSDHIYQRLKTSESWIMQKPEWVEIFAPNGSIAEVGSIIKRPALANTLTTIAKEGANAYYEGPIAESIVNTITKNGGILTLEDFKNYRAIERPVVNTTYNGHIVHTTSAPTSGPILLNVLNLIEPYQFSVDGPTGLNYHRLIEALKFGYAARSEFGDPSFTGNQERLDEIASKAWADSIRPQITDETTHNVSYYNPKYESNDPHGTMHLSIVDSDHGAVAQTTTINLLFGSKVMDRETGIIFNDQQADFSSPGTINAYGYSPTKNNFIAPGKRPLSSTTPTIIEDAQGQLKMVVGSSGGSHIVSGAMNVIINALDFKEELFQAVGTPRLHHQLMPNELGAEIGFDPLILADLANRGHQVVDMDIKTTVFSAVQAVILHANGTLDAVSDPRKSGLGAAY